MIAMVAGLGAGCSLLVDVDQLQCRTGQECLDRGLGARCIDRVCLDPSDTEVCDGGRCAAEANGDGAQACGSARCSRTERCFEGTCLAASQVERLVCEPDEARAESSSGEVRLQMAIQGFVSRAAPVGMRVSACRRNDVDCTDPQTTFLDQAGTGEVELTVPRGFTGFVEIRSDDLVTSLWYSSEPLLSDTRVFMLIPETAAYRLLASTAGVEAEPGKGLVVLEVYDCENTVIDGIRFSESKGGAIPFFIVDDVPNIEVTTTMRDGQENMAPGGFINVEPGFIQLTAHLGTDGPVVASLNALVRAESMTYVEFHRPRYSEEGP